MSDDALIHLRVPASIKARWVRESRSAGMRLTDWIIERVEAPKKMTTIAIPTGLKFSDLRLARDPSGDVSFDTSVIERIEQASGLPAGFFLASPEDALGELIIQWYRMHLSDGGAPDATADDLIAEARAEDAAGQHYSHAPGRA